MNQYAYNERMAREDGFACNPDEAAYADLADEGIEVGSDDFSMRLYKSRPTTLVLRCRCGREYELRQKDSTDSRGTDIGGRSECPDSSAHAGTGPSERAA